MSVLILRHAQSLFNVVFDKTNSDPGLNDAPLSPGGMKQARQLRRSLAALNIRRVIVSPLTRSIQTALVTFPRSEIVADPLVREGLFSSCDIGRQPEELRREFPQVDFGAVRPDWWHLPNGENSRRHIEADLISRVRAFSASLPEKDGVAVVSHAAFLHRLTGKNFQNCEYLVCHGAEYQQR